MQHLLQKYEYFVRLQSKTRARTHSSQYYTTGTIDLKKIELQHAQLKNYIQKLTHMNDISLLT